MNVTLESVRQRQNELAEMIAMLEATAGKTTVEIEYQQIELASGERYAGMMLNEDGTPSHHLVLLPAEATEITWPDANEWAREQGGALPTRKEQSLLFANAGDAFKNAWYWSAEQLAADADYAWCQDFGNGYQNDSRKLLKLRARAVRRLTI